MLYNFSNVQVKILQYLKQSSVKLDKTEINKILSYLSVQSLIKNGHIDHIYFETSMKPFLLDKKQVEEITENLDRDCHILLPLEKLTSSDYIFDSLNVSKFNVKTIEDYDLVLDLFLENSKYGEIIKKEKAKKEKRKEETIKTLKIEKNKKNAIFDKISSLERNFEDKKILSVDLEFFLNKKEKTHRISEIGISYKSPNNSKNVHFLIEEYYRLKVNNKGQNKFEFGNTEILTINNAKKYLMTALEHVDFILFHEAREDLAALKEIGLDIKKNFPNVTVIDTQESYKRYFAATMSSGDESYAKGKSLSVLTDLFKVAGSENSFHNAGNDAEYTLRLLFAMKSELERRRSLDILNEQDPVMAAVKILISESKRTGKSIEVLISEKTSELTKTKKSDDKIKCSVDRKKTLRMN